MSVEKSIVAYVVVAFGLVLSVAHPRRNVFYGALIEEARLWMKAVQRLFARNQKFRWWKVWTGSGIMLGLVLFLNVAPYYLPEDDLFQSFGFPLTFWSLVRGYVPEYYFSGFNLLLDILTALAGAAFCGWMLAKVRWPLEKRNYALN